MIEGIPEFLKIPQEERNAAWKLRAAKPLPAEPKHSLPPIQGIPGASPDDDPDA